MITFKDYLALMGEYSLNPISHYKPGAMIGGGGGAKLNPMKSVNPARPHRYQPLFRANSKKGRGSQKSSSIVGK